MKNFKITDATHLHLIGTDNVGICYADCPSWHGCDCPQIFVILVRN